MIRKIAALLVLAFFLLTHSAYAQQYRQDYGVELSAEECMYILDKGDHFPKEFKPILKDIYCNHYNYTKDEVAAIVISSYEVIQREKPQTSMYDTLADVQRYSQDELGIDLTTYIVAYIRSQLK